MKLLLTSTGITNETIKTKFLEMVGKQPSDISLAYIPTAFNTSSSPDKRWAIENIIRLNDMGIGNIDIVDFSVIPKEMWLPRLQRADVIFVEGGTPSYLMTEMKKADIPQLLVSDLKDKVYVGCSAGSNVLGEVVIKSSKDAPGYIKEDGFKLVDFSIRPHYMRRDRMQFDDDVIAGFAKEYNSDFYAIDDNSAIAVENGKIEIVSDGNWKKFSKTPEGRI